MEQLSTDNFAAIGAPNHGLEDEIDSPALRDLFRHWRQKRGKRAMPARGDLAEDTLNQGLGKLILFELSCAGTPSAPSKNADDALTGGMATPYHEVMRRGQPMYRRHAEPAGAVERLLLPLSRDGVHVDAILVGVQRRH